MNATIMKKGLVIIFILLFSHLKFYSQTDSIYKIRNIRLKIDQSGLIPYSQLKLSFSYLRDNVEVKLKSSARNDDERWDYSRINKTFNIPVEDFLELKKAIEKIELNNIFKGTRYSFKDGYRCSLSYDGFGGAVSLEFRSPTSETKERGIVDYLNACILILKKGGLEDSVIKRILSVETF